MQFLFPSFLWALLALSIPIIIHLFHFRRFKKVIFTNVKFLKEVKEDTSTNKNIKQLLVLLSRIGALAFMVLAFAQPFIPINPTSQKGISSVSIYVDNSFSMNSLSSDVPMIDKAKKSASGIIKAFAPDDRFQILTNDFEGRHQRLISKEEALTYVEEIVPSPAVKKISQVIERQKQTLKIDEKANKQLYLISDYQANIFDIESYDDSLHQLTFIPIKSVEEKNISIDSTWFEEPAQILNQNATLFIKVTNNSNEKAEGIRLTYTSEGQTKPIGSLNINAKSSLIDTFEFPILKTGWHEAELSITDYPVQFDDKMYLTFYVDEVIHVLSINQLSENKSINAAFKGAKNFILKNSNASNINYATLVENNLIILNEMSTISSGLSSELIKYVESGGNLIIFPNANINTSSYNNFLRRVNANDYGQFNQENLEVFTINTKEFIFKNVFKKTKSKLILPKVKSRYPINTQGGRGGESLLGFRDGTNFVEKHNYQKGHIYLCSSPLNTNYSDLVNNAGIFIPLLYKAALAKTNSDQIAHIIGYDKILEANHKTSSGEITYKLKNGLNEFIPQQQIVQSKVIFNIGNELKQPGVYNLELNNEALFKYAFNYDRRESNLKITPISDIEAFTTKNKVNLLEAENLESFSSLIGEQQKGKQLWRWCIIFALIFLMIEVLLLRLWKS